MIKSLKNGFNKFDDVSKGLLYLVTAASVFATMGIFVRLASQIVDNNAVVFMRNAVALCLLVPWCFAVNGSIDLKTDHIHKHIVRAVAGFVGMYGFFYAIANMPLSNAMVFVYSSPIFIPIVARIFLKEPITKRMWACVFIGFAGVLLVAKPSDGGFNHVSLIGIMASICASVAFVSIRSMASTEPVARIVLYFAIFSTSFALIPIVFDWHTFVSTMNKQAWLYLIIAGALATFSQIVMSKAYSYAPAGTIGPANYFAIVCGGIWGYVLWGEIPDAISLVGMALIFVAILMCMPNFLIMLKNKLTGTKT